MNRYFIFLEYNGADFCGWQIQPNAPSVQQTIEEALSLILRRSCHIVGAGRTDTGVHAKQMIAHFDYDSELPDTLVDRLNRILPRSIAIHKIESVKPDSHARFDATARTYHYMVCTRKDVFTTNYALRCHSSIDFEMMNQAAAKLFDYTDFTSFSKLHTDAKTNNCKIMQAEWKQNENGLWTFTIKADRFLRNMVRAIVGTLLEVGRGKLSITDFCRIIEEKDRCKAGTSVAAHALFLVKIDYPEDI